MPEKIELLTFDLDDTLWPCDQTILAAEKTLYQWMQQRVPAITDRYSMQALRDRRIAFHKQHENLKHDLSRLRIASLQALASETGLDHDWVQEAFEIYFAARQRVTLFEDVAPVLDELHNSYRMVAVSNGNADITKTGVSHWFEFAISSAEVGQSKPHPSVFETVLDRAGVAASKAIHIGDDQHHDIFGASQAGLRSIWVNRSHQPWQHTECEADVHVSNFTELPQVLEELGRL